MKILATKSVLENIAAQDDQTRPTIPRLPSILFPVRGILVYKYPYPLGYLQS